MHIIEVSHVPALDRNDSLVVLCNDALIYYDHENVGIDLSPHKDTPMDSHHKIEVETGVKVVISPNLVGKVYARSSTYKNYGLLLSNGVGIIDPSYRGEIKCIFVVHDIYRFYNRFKDGILPRHTRVAQLVLEPIKGLVGNIYILRDDSVFENLANIFPTKRGEGGFGSTGV